MSSSRNPWSAAFVVYLVSGCASSVTPASPTPDVEIVDAQEAAVDVPRLCPDGIGCAANQVCLEVDLETVTRPRRCVDVPTTCLDDQECGCFGSLLCTEGAARDCHMSADRPNIVTCTCDTCDSIQH